MALNKIHRLDLSWAISKGRDTYGLNIARLDDSISGKRYRTCGTGYDMIGTILADWFEDQYQNDLIKLVQSNSDKLEVYSMTCPGWQKVEGLYGMVYHPGENRVSLDGGCGVESITRIIEACGFEVERASNKKGHTVAFYVQKVQG